MKTPVSRRSAPLPSGENKEGETPTPPMLRLYLREMAETPLLEEQDEVRLASQLQGSRLAIAKLARALPASCRDVVLAGDRSGPALGAAWPLAHLERFVAKLTHEAALRPDVAIAARLREIKIHKASLDEAREGLILANLRLVVHIAKKYAKGGLPFMDLIQEGNLGLLRAVEKFEYARGYKFSTYAFWWIRQSVERGVVEKLRTIRIPVHVNEQVRKVDYAARDLGQQLGRKATPAEIAACLTTTEDAVSEVQSIVQEPVALEDSDRRPGAYDLANTIADVSMPSPFHHVAYREIRQRVESVLSKLRPREATVIRMRFGIGRDASRTLEEVGNRLRLSRERVRQIEGLALAKIKASPLSRELAELSGLGAAPVLRARASR